MLRIEIKKISDQIKFDSKLVKESVSKVLSSYLKLSRVDIIYSLQMSVFLDLSIFDNIHIMLL